jgi:very-short-patch-repair endonuclease
MGAAPGFFSGLVFSDLCFIKNTRKPSPPARGGVSRHNVGAGWWEIKMNNKIFNQKDKKSTRRFLRKEMPKGEILLWQKLKNNQMGYKFRRQQGIDRYVVDFYCPKLKLAMEVDGRTHDYHDQIIYDRERQKHIEALGINVKRFYSEEIFENIDSVMEQIYLICEELKKKM